MDARVKEMILNGGRARPSVQYDALAVRVRGAQAVLSGKVTDSEAGTTQYTTVQFKVEDNQWKVAREQWSDRPFDAFVLSAWLPPEEGTLLRDGAPFKAIAYATPNPRVLGKSEMQWKIQATMDESSLSIRAFRGQRAAAGAGRKIGTAGRENRYHWRPAAAPAHAHQGIAVVGTASHGSRICCLGHRPGFHASRLRVGRQGRG